MIRAKPTPTIVATRLTRAASIAKAMARVISPMYLTGGAGADDVVAGGVDGCADSWRGGVEGRRGWWAEDAIRRIVRRSRDAIKKIVCGARADADGVADLVGEAEALLRDRGGHRRTSGDFVDEPPERVAVGKSRRSRRRSAARGGSLASRPSTSASKAPPSKNSAITCLRPSLASRVAQRGLDPRRLEHGLDHSLELGAVKYKIDGTALESTPASTAAERRLPAASSQSTRPCSRSRRAGSVHATSR